MKILVPVDFYDASFSAFQYACHIAEILKADITMLNVVNGTLYTAEAIAYDPLKELEESAIKRLEYFVQEYPVEKGITLPISPKEKVVEFGIPGFTIAAYADKHKFDLIVMGTRDKHGIFDMILGSASSITIRRAHCPVILVHEGTRFLRPQKVAFAFDHKGDIEHGLGSYNTLNSYFGAKTDFVHVNKNKKDDITHQTNEILDKVFDGEHPPYPFEIKIIKGKDISAALMDYCLFEKVDLLAMVHRQDGIFNNVFKTNYSITVAQKTHLPVIIFPECKSA